MIKIDHKAYYRKNRKRILKYQKEYKKKYPEKRKLWCDKYRARPEIKERYNEYYFHKRFSPKYKYNLAKRKAIERKKLEFLLTFKVYDNIVKKGCYYCSKNLYTEQGVSLDRIINNIGYVRTNVIPCCGNCNMIRGTRLTVEETKRTIKLIQKLRRTKNIWKDYKYTKRGRA